MEKTGNLFKENKMKLSDYYGKANYQLQYTDYGPDQWTAPCKLTKERAEKFLKDYSVTKVKLLPNAGVPLVAGDMDCKEIELDLVDSTKEPQGNMKLTKTQRE